MKVHEKTMCKDPGFVIEQHLLKYFAEGGAQAALTQICECLPSANKLMSVKESLAQLDVIMNSALFRWSCAETQASVRIVQNLISGLQHGVAPEFDTSPSDPLREVQKRLPLFENGKESSASQPRVLRGAAAVQHLWKELQKKKVVSLSDLDGIGPFLLLAFSFRLESFPR